MSIYISGAVSIVVANYNNTKFILFGDYHGSYEGICDNNNIKNGNSTCYTVDGVIANIIQEANKNGEY